MSADSISEETGALLIATGVSTIKPAPKANRFENCLSCDTSTATNYCPNCGQKNDDLRRSLFAMIADIFGNVFAFESRMWRTWGALMFKPGKIARTYADGNRMRYSAPIRTYLVVSLLFFSFMGLSNTHFLSFEVKPSDKSQTEALEALAGSLELTIDKNSPIEPLIPKQDTSDNIDFAKLFRPNGYEYGVRFFVRDRDLYKLSEKQLQDVIGSTPDQETPENFLKINNRTYDRETFLRTLLSNPKQFNSTFNTWLPRAMFFMVPFAMILGWIFLRGPKALLIDHLIHAMYLQSALFIALLLAVISSRLISGASIALPLFGVMAFYFMISLKRMFNRGWIKTIWTTLVGGWLYLMILLLIMGAITFLAFANIAAPT